MRTLHRCLVFVALLWGSAALASAQNLLRNGTFDSGISLWETFNDGTVTTTATFSPLDAGGDAASGSIRVTSTSPGAIGGWVSSECIPVVPGVTYQKRFEYLIEPGNATWVSSQVNFYGDAICSPGSSMIGHGGIVASQADGAWHPNLDSADRYTAPAGARGVQLDLYVGKTVAGGSVTAHFDNAAFQVVNDCSSLQDVLCLNDDRFQVVATWNIPEASGRAHVARLTDDTGYLWFFDPSNVEVVIKVLDACDGFGRFWVFAGGLTNVEVEITVLDSKTGETKTYRNELGQPFAPLQDTNAFAACP